MRPLTITLPHGVSETDVATARAAGENDPASREKFRELLARRADLVERIGIITRETEATLLDSFHGRGVFAEEAARAELNLIRESLSTPRDGALERLLIERIGLCWLSLCGAERSRAARWKDGVTHDAGDFWDRHVSRLNEDFLRACKALATTRRLLGPRVQVNIGAQQVNVA